MNERPADRSNAKSEQRRVSRFRVVVPVEARWHAAAGKSVQETAQAEEVSALGGMLDLKTHPAVGTHLELINLLSNEVTQARVAAIRHSKEGAVRGIAVEFLVPNESFWGVNFQLKKTSAELVKIEQAIQSGTVDSRILKEFRDAVDYVRRTAWAVQEWQERQLQKHDPQTVLPLITAERIRRATQLNTAITNDLVRHEVTRETAGVAEFLQAVESLYRHLADLFQGE